MLGVLLYDTSTFAARKALREAVTAPLEDAEVKQVEPAQAENKAVTRKRIAKKG